MKYTLDDISDRIFHAVRSMEGKDIAELCNREFGMGIAYIEDGMFGDIEFKTAVEVEKWLEPMGLLVRGGTSMGIHFKETENFISPEFKNWDELVLWANQNKETLEQYVKQDEHGFDDQRLLRKLLGYK